MPGHRKLGRQLETLWERKGYEIAQIYQDQESGRLGRGERRGFDQLFRDARLGKFGDSAQDDERVMRTYDFTLILSTSPTEEVVDKLYGYFGPKGEAPHGIQSVVIGLRAGVPYAGCTVRADSFELALQAVLPGFQREGIEVERVEVEKDDLSSLLAA